MEAKLIALMKRFMPNLDLDKPFEVSGRFMDFYGVIYAGVLSIIGILWLVSIAEPRLLINNWEVCLFILGAEAFFRHYPFFIVFQLADDQTGDIGGSLSFIMLASAVWLFGPTALILFLMVTVASRTYAYLYIRRNRHHVQTVWWNFARNVTTEVAALTFFALLPLQIYVWAGGTYPIDQLQIDTMLLPIGVGILWSVFNLFAYLPIYLSLTLLSGLRTSVPHRIRIGIILRTIFPAAIDAIMIAFAVLATALYHVGGPEFYVFNIAGFMLAAYVSHHLSQAVERNRRRSVEAEALEQLSQALLESQPDGSELATILRSKVRNLISQARLDIRLFPDDILITDDELTWVLDAHVWTWLQQNATPLTVKQGNTPVWSTDQRPSPTSVVLVPILDRDTNTVIGGIYVELLLSGIGAVNQPDHLLPSTQALAHQIETALHSANVYRQTLEFQKTAQELEFAGKIQSSFLPTEIPHLAGWDIAATILPARQTSGDFYDFVRLDNGNLGILVADVADKGTGAALYMALSRTLIRTYAMQFPDAPAGAFRAANERILSDTKSDQFVTVFYAILKPDSGELIYANAGHNPAILLCKNGETQMLSKTGVPLGMFEGLNWKQNSVLLSKGDILILYTDGASEAQNADNDEFGESRIIESAREHSANTAEDVQDSIMQAIQGFVGDAPQFDDITLMIAQRL